MESKSTNWLDGDEVPPTSEPGVAVAALQEGLPALTVATIIGVALVVLVAIAIVFVLGVLIDCRQQRLLDKKMGEMKRTRSRRAPAQASDGASIVEHMEESASSTPPADALRHVP